jgi:hypothetical protein
MRARDLAASELDGWDAATVDPPGGHVLQSRAWAEYRSRHGWQPRFVALDDGARVLVLEQQWPLIRSRSAWIPSGPIPDGAPLDVVRARLLAVVGHLRAQGVDVVATDAEVPAGTGYEGVLEGLGFRPIEELRSSRHRMVVPLAGVGEEAAFAGVRAAVRQAVRRSDREELVTVRLDRRWTPRPGDPWVTPDPGETPEALLRAAYALLRETAERRGFRLGPLGDYLDWSTTALEAGHLVLLGVRDPAGLPLASATFHRHGRRLTYALSGNRAEARLTHPGAAHLLVWRALQVALAEGRAEMDLGGADVRGARRVPHEGEPMYGLYDFKRAFGGTWVDQVAAHEGQLRPARYLLGRILARARR